MSDPKINAQKVSEIFTGDNASFLDDNWALDDLELDISEIKDEFFDKAPIELMEKVADAFGCKALANAGHRFSRDEFKSCQIKETTDSPSTKPTDEYSIPSPYVNIIGQAPLEDFLNNADKSKPVLIFVWSRNCHPCVKNKPKVVALSEKASEKANFLAMEFPSPLRSAPVHLYPNEFLSDKYGISGFPCIVALKFVNGNWEHKLIKSEYVRDENGDVILNEKGRPAKTIPILDTLKEYLDKL
ncbi:MAG: thioredoxin family protein [Syntrophaceae bacterium]|nr:thioredoxin family protein [Syntrophaceae bacterium]